MAVSRLISLVILGFFIVIATSVMFLRFTMDAPVNQQKMNSLPQGSEIPQEQTAAAKVYFANIDLSTDPNDCSEVIGVPRDLPRNAGYFQLLSELLKGPTLEEQKAGFSSFFSADTEGSLWSIKIEGGTAYVNFADIREIIPNASTSCGSSEFMSEVGTTLRQFGEVNEVIYAIEGNPSLFYEWMQLSCPLESNGCDPSLFN